MYEHFFIVETWTLEKGSLNWLIAYLFPRWNHGGDPITTEATIFSLIVDVPVESYDRERAIDLGFKAMFGTKVSDWSEWTGNRFQKLY